VKPLAEWIGGQLLKAALQTGEIVMLHGRLWRWMFRRPFEAQNTLVQMLEIGVRSFPVVALTSLSTGMVLALQTALTLEYRFAGISQFLGGVVSLSITRELGPVLTALMVAGRVGSAIAAELGTMAVTEQLDALQTMATHPIQYLGVPRLLACMVMLPTLTIFADAIGIVGGGLVSVMYSGIPMSHYFDTVNFYLRMGDVMNGLVKTVVFGMTIATIGCYMGFTTTGGAEGVGRSTTRAVVISSIMILIFDYILTALLF